VAPGIGTPLRDHTYVRVPPPVASTLNVAAVPGATVTSSGSEVISGELAVGTGAGPASRLVITSAAVRAREYTATRFTVPRKVLAPLGSPPMVSGIAALQGENVPVVATWPTCTPLTYSLAVLPDVRVRTRCVRPVPTAPRAPVARLV
jgi:hypothetical protein